MLQLHMSDAVSLSAASDVIVSDVTVSDAATILFQFAQVQKGGHQTTQPEKVQPRAYQVRKSASNGL